MKQSDGLPEGPENLAARPVNSSSSANWEQLKSRLNPARMEYYNLGPSGIGQVRKLATSELLSATHFDLFAKHIYARFSGANLASGWGRQVYDGHIYAFNRFDEGDGSGKRGREAFRQSFDDLLESIKTRGFEESQTIVPVTPGKFVLDGAHRVVACFYYHKDVTVVEVEAEAPVWDYRFFRKRGMPVEHMDDVAIEFCRLKPEARMVLVPPSASVNAEKAEEVLRRSGEIFYERKIYLNRSGALNLVRELQRHDPGTVRDDAKSFVAAYDRMNKWFTRRGPLQVYVMASADNALSSACHELSRLAGHDGIFRTETQEASIEMAELLLNGNSVEFLCNADPLELVALDEHVDHFRRSLLGQGLDRNSVCITGQSALAFHGAGDMRGIEYFYHIESGLAGHNAAPAASRGLIDRAIGSDELLFNPQNHFNYRGVKIMARTALQRVLLEEATPNALRSLELLHRNARKVWMNAAHLRALHPGMVMDAISSEAERLRTGFMLSGVGNFIYRHVGFARRVLKLGAKTVASLASNPNNS